MFCSQLEQLEEVHKTDDAEFNEMKEEFTSRISNAENKLQVAAKVGLFSQLYKTLTICFIFIQYMKEQLKIFTLIFFAVF